jgi:hypothetical protein
LTAFLLARLADIDPRQITLLLAMLQGGIAAIIALRQDAPSWWIGIHLGFVPLMVVVQRLEIDPYWFLCIFLLLLLVFWRTDKSRVPLYLTNRVTAAAVTGLIPAGPQKIIDLGCGEAGLLCQLASARPDCSFVGIEHAPLTWLIAWLRTRHHPNITIQRGNFWVENLTEYPLVYTFLSPAPMLQLWQKAKTEMAPEAVLVSNSFEIPGICAERVIQVSDRRATRLYLYHPAR